jgi:ubiquinone/menaquinone biosynthesis C-methylase UbiE
VPAVTEPEHLRNTRAGYDSIAEEYAERFAHELGNAPLDRAVMAAFAELVRRDHETPEVLDVGSGPGDVTAHLLELGLSVRGVDLSPAMVDLARREHPSVAFEVGEMSALAAGDSTLAGVVAWYSLIHVPEVGRPDVLAEFHRVLAPGGHLLLGFQIGDDTQHHDRAFGHPVSLDFHRLRPEAVVALLADAGFEVVVRTEKAPEPDSRASPIPQGTLIARRPRTRHAGAASCHETPNRSSTHPKGPNP